MGKQTEFETIVDLPKPYRILSMDGGGIYGLFTALMLRKLCERDKTFLKGDQITLFAGTSAGALISLLLAKEKNPRDAVLSGEVENIFCNGLMYNNRLDPLNALLSYTMLTPWTGSRGADRLYRDHFGDMTIGELKHRILIAGFDVSGTAMKKNRRWKPKVFYNFPNNEPDRSLLVREVAYGATSPLGWRPVRNGITDGYVFADNPCVQAIAKICKQTRDVEFARNRFKDVILRGSIENNFYQEQIARGVHPDATGNGDSTILKFKRASMLSEKTIRDDLDPLSPAQWVADCNSFGKTLRRWAARLTALDKEFKMEGRELNPNYLGMKRHYVETLAEQSEFFRGVDRKPGREESRERTEIISRIVRLSVADLVFIKESYIQLEPRELSELQKSVVNEIDDLRHDMERFLRGEGAEGWLDRIQAMMEVYFAKKEYIFSIIEPSIEESLKNMSVLSLGVGNNVPYYFKSNFNFGAIPIYWLPANMAQKEFFGPMTRLALEPVAEGASFQARQLLGAERFHRLCPGIVDFPVPPASICIFLARYSILRNLIIKGIKKKIYVENDSIVEAAIQQTLAWLEKNDWPTWDKEEEAPKPVTAARSGGAVDEILARFRGMSEEEKDRLLEKLNGARGAGESGVKDG